MNRVWHHIGIILSIIWESIWTSYRHHCWEKYLNNCGHHIGDMFGNLTWMPPKLTVSSCATSPWHLGVESDRGQQYCYCLCFFGTQITTIFVMVSGIKANHHCVSGGLEAKPQICLWWFRRQPDNPHQFVASPKPPLFVVAVVGAKPQLFLFGGALGAERRLFVYWFN